MEHHVLRAQLAELLRVQADSLPRIRVTPDARRLPALVDIARIITGHNARNSVGVIHRLFVRYPELLDKCERFKFGGQGQQATYIPKTLSTLIEFVMLLPGQKAAVVRTEVAKVFVRYLGGDVALIQEVKHLHHVQEFVRDNGPEHIMSPFDKEVELGNAQQFLDEASTGQGDSGKKNSSVTKTSWQSFFLLEKKFLQ